MIKQKFEKIIEQRCTLLGVGPMSVNCVDATIELANEYETTIILIASRRQVDSAEFGGGYVNNWTTPQFANYVIDKDRKGKVVLARDHGGPWQNPNEVEVQLSFRRAMESAKSSFKEDINSGFQILHIDTSLDIYGKPKPDEIIERAFDLYEYCWSYAQQSGVEVLFEIGTEEQSGGTNIIDELEYTLKSFNRLCKKNSMPLPLFIVVQNGTRVVESRNVGTLDLHARVAGEIPPEIQIPKIVDLCNSYGVYIKAHNTDYLSNETLRWHPRLGIHSANVAPEFGVTETRALFRMMREHNFTVEADKFMQLAYDSGKWKKWLAPNSNITDLEKATIAGHYVFSTPEFIDIKVKVTAELKQLGIDLDRVLIDQVKESILRYLILFRLVRC